MNLARALYSLLTWAAQPLLRRKLRRRAQAEPGYAQAIPERFGHYQPPSLGRDGAGQWIWIHAVSLGETRAAALLLEPLRAHLPSMRLLLTHSTATGRAEGAKLLQPGDVQVWLPWDTPGAVQRFLEQFRPLVGILMETEVWPNLVASCRQAGIPLVLANARLNAKSFAGAQRWRSLSHPAYAGLSAGAAWAQSAPVKLRFGHAHPTSDSQHVAALEFARKVKERTQGGIEIQVFPSNQLGNDNSMIAGVRGGTIDIEMSGNPYFTGIEPKLNVLDLPYLFDNMTHVAKVLDGSIGRSLLNDLESKQMKGLAFWEIGFRSLANSRRPVSKAEDIKGLKLRTTPNPAHIKAFQLLGAAPQPMPFSEVYSALETKAIDGHENPPSVMLSTKMHEVQKYLSLTKHAYTALVVVMN